jgi:hypothetical protein
LVYWFVKKLMVFSFFLLRFSMMDECSFHESLPRMIIKKRIAFSCNFSMLCAIPVTRSLATRCSLVSFTFVHRTKSIHRIIKERLITSPLSQSPSSRHQEKVPMLRDSLQESSSRSSIYFFTLVTLGRTTAFCYPAERF